jgi:hypothetical protein
MPRRAGLDPWSMDGRSGSVKFGQLTGLWVRIKPEGFSGVPEQSAADAAAFHELSEVRQFELMQARQGASAWRIARCEALALGRRVPYPKSRRPRSPADPLRNRIGELGRLASEGQSFSSDVQTRLDRCANLVSKW